MRGISQKSDATDVFQAINETAIAGFMASVFTKNVANIDHKIFHS
jgi:hypothetical protein